ncbi:MAG: 30S ribosomal protein S6 [Phycisphaerales bacterium JB059]
MTQTAEKTNAYEVMFLTSQGTAADLNGLVEHLGELFNRAGAEIISLRKWDERRLAFPIETQKRGVYFLAYVNMPIDGPAHLERDCVISEKIMRVLITRADHLTLDEMTVHDKRDELATEAKLKAEQGDAGEERRSGVSLGAPVAPAAPEAPKSAEEAPGEGEAPSEAKPEASEG